MKRLPVIAVVLFAATTVWAQDPASRLFDAVRRNDVTAVKHILQGGAKPDVRDRIGDTPLVLAARAGNVEIIDALLAAKARPALRSTYGKNPIVEAASKGHADAVERLILADAPVDSTDADGTTPLIAASARGDLDLMRFLLDRKAQVDRPDVSGATPLMRAAANNRLEAMELLLARGADLKRLDRFRRTALFYATSNARVEAAKRLIERGVDVKARDVEGLDAFQSVIETMTAGSNERIEDRIATLRAILDRFNPNARTLLGRTALMIAAERGSVPVVRYLLTVKAEVNAKDRYGKTALDWAEMKMRDDVAAVLKEAGAISGG